MAVLETLIRQLAAGRPAGGPPPTGRHAGVADRHRPPRPSAPRRAGHRRPRRRPPRPHPRPPATPAPAPPPPRPVARAPAAAAGAGPTGIPRPPRTPALDSERWIGQRVFLGIGVVALLMAAGYLLKLCFDRNWISPAMRCIGGSTAGLAVGALGWRLEPRIAPTARR